MQCAYLPTWQARCSSCCIATYAACTSHAHQAGLLLSMLLVNSRFAVSRSMLGPTSGLAAQSNSHTGLMSASLKMNCPVASMMGLPSGIFLTALMPLPCVLDLNFCGSNSSSRGRAGKRAGKQAVQLINMTLWHGPASSAAAQTPDVHVRWRLCVRGNDLSSRAGQCTSQLVR